MMFFDDFIRKRGAVGITEIADTGMVFIQVSPNPLIREYFDTFFIDKPSIEELSKCIYVVRDLSSDHLKYHGIVNGTVQTEKYGVFYIENENISSTDVRKELLATNGVGIETIPSMSIDMMVSHCFSISGVFYPWGRILGEKHEIYPARVTAEVHCGFDSIQIKLESQIFQEKYMYDRENFVATEDIDSVVSETSTCLLDIRRDDAWIWNRAIRKAIEGNGFYGTYDDIVLLLSTEETNWSGRNFLDTSEIVSHTRAYRDVQSVHGEIREIDSIVGQVVSIVENGLMR